MNRDIKSWEGKIRYYIQDLKSLIELDDDLDYESVNGADCCIEAMKIRDDI